MGWRTRAPRWRVAGRLPLVFFAVLVTCGGDSGQETVCEDLVCAAGASCDDSGSDAVCLCPEGLGGDGLADGEGCSDIDECAVGSDDCDVGATCTNSDGGYECACGEGFTGDGYRASTGCSDIDECATDAHDCAELALCRNNAGGYRCTCDVGYVGDALADGTGCVLATIEGSLTQADPGAFNDGWIPVSCAEYLNPPAPYEYGGVTGSGYYLIEPPGAGASFPAYCDMTNDGGGWSRIVRWNRASGMGSKATLLSALSVDFDNMGDFSDQTGYVRWSDLDADGDVLALHHSTLIPNGGELRLRVVYTGDSMEDSGIWFFATADGSEQNVLCWDDSAATVDVYSPGELAWAPDYACPNNDPGLGATSWTWDRTELVSLSGPVTSFHIRSFHSDVNLGDQSRLARITVFVR